MCSIHCGVSGLLLFSATNKIHLNLTAKCSKIRNDMLHSTLVAILRTPHAFLGAFRLLVISRNYKHHVRHLKTLPLLFGSLRVLSILS